MPFQETNIQGLWVFEPRVFEDNRGYFFESYNHNTFVEATGIDNAFVQDNHSFSTYGVMRGLHFQKPPHDQAKLVRVIAGKVLDVAVDIRKNSETFGKYFSVELSAENKKQLYIPRGFAHGFVVLGESAELLYKCDNFYTPQAEGGIIFNDKDIDIDWQIPEKDMIVSEKDLLLKSLKELEDIF